MSVKRALEFVHFDCATPGQTDPQRLCATYQPSGFVNATVTRDQSKKGRSGVARVTFPRSGRSVEDLPRLKDYALELLQICVCRFGFFQGGDVAVGVFPNCQEVLIGGAGFGRVPLHGVGRASPRQANAPQGKFITTPRWSMNFWNSAVARLPSWSSR